MKEPTLQEQLDRGIKAQKLLADQLFNEAFQTVSNAIHDQWANCPMRDKEGAHELRVMLKILGDVRAVFECAVDDGKAAAAELKSINKQVLSPAQWSGRK